MPNSLKNSTKLHCQILNQKQIEHTNRFINIKLPEMIQKKRRAGLAKFTDKDQEAIARMHGVSEQIQWVEIQQTSSGLSAEMSFKVWP